MLLSSSTEVHACIQGPLHVQQHQLLAKCVLQSPSASPACIRAEAGSMGSSSAVQQQRLAVQRDTLRP